MITHFPDHRPDFREETCFGSGRKGDKAGSSLNEKHLTFYKGQEVTLMDAMIISSEENPECDARTIVSNNRELHIRCKDNIILQINTLSYQ